MIRFPFSLAVLVWFGITAMPVGAETFTVSLGKTVLGTLSHTRSGTDELLQSTLSNTPLGVFNGSFVGTSKRVANPSGGTAQKFVGTSKSSRKHRTVSTLIAEGQAFETDVTPETEKTDLSDITLVPAGVTDPVIAIGQLINANNGCPDTVQIYDGRRAISLLPNGSEQVESTLICHITYKVVAGPGHLSPLKISSAKMTLRYGVGANQQRLAQIKLRSGIFSLYLDLVD